MISCGFCCCLFVLGFLVHFSFNSTRDRVEFSADSGISDCTCWDQGYSISSVPMPQEAQEVRKLLLLAFRSPRMLPQGSLQPFPKPQLIPLSFWGLSTQHPRNKGNQVTVTSAVVTECLAEEGEIVLVHGFSQARLECAVAHHTAPDQEAGSSGGSQWQTGLHWLILTSS